MASIGTKRMDKTRNRSCNPYLSRGPFSSPFWPDDDDSLANFAEFISVELSWIPMVARLGVSGEATAIAISVFGIRTGRKTGKRNLRRHAKHIHLHLAPKMKTRAGAKMRHQKAHLRGGGANVESCRVLSLGLQLCVNARAIGPIRSTSSEIFCRLQLRRTCKKSFVQPTRNYAGLI
jgi:hypothetical protein